MKRWYVVQVYSGYESAARDDIERRINNSKYQESFGEILVPSAKFKTFLTTEEIKNEQLFPGYILIQMELSAETMKIVTASIRVLKFLGGADPKPLSESEVDRIRQQMIGEVSIKHEQTMYDVGREVEIHEGPFAGFMGIVEAVRPEQEKLTVMVSFFGRMMPVEVGFSQVK